MRTYAAAQFNHRSLSFRIIQHGSQWDSLFWRLPANGREMPLHKITRRLEETYHISVAQFNAGGIYGILVSSNWNSLTATFERVRLPSVRLPVCDSLACPAT